ncbi:MAG: GDSL-type esterase/lipase family protein [Kiritimatiellia bacterium]
MTTKTTDAVEARPLRLLIFGASTTAYRGNLEIASFQVSDSLAARGIAQVFFNSGVGGNTTAMARKRFERDVLGLFPDIVFILIGTNDCAIDVWEGKTEPRVSEKDYADNLRFFARELKKRDITAAFMTIQPMYMTDDLRKIYGRAPYTEKGFNFMVDKYAAAMKRVAAEENIPCLDVNRKFWQAAGNEYEKLPEFYSDGMHPNRKGQAIIAGEMLGLLEKNPGLLEKRSPYADQVKHLAVELPAGRKTYPAGALLFRLATPQAPARIQYRAKPHSGAPKDFGEWLEAGHAFQPGPVSGSIQGLAPNTYSFQFRTLNGQGKVSRLGGVDYVTIK